MRVVYDGPLLGPRGTGTAVHLERLLSATLARRSELHLVSRHATLRRVADHESSARRIGAEVEARTTRVPTRVLRSAETYLRLPRERWLAGRFDLYHQLHLDADPAVPNRRLIVTVYDVVAALWPGEEGVLHPRAPHLLRRAAAVCAVSEFTRSVVQERFNVPADRIFVVPAGVDHVRFNPSAAAAELTVARTTLNLPPRYLVHVGGTTTRKNLAGLLAAFALVAEQEPDLHLVHAGPGTHGLGIAAAPYAARVHSLGFVSDALLPSLYAGADALVFPSLYEGFGIPILEAFAVGTPVVTSTVTSMPEVAGGAAQLVDPYDPPDIASGILKVLRLSEAEKQARREAGLLRAGKLTWDAAAESLLHVYDRVAGNL